MSLPISEKFILGFLHPQLVDSAFLDSVTGMLLMKDHNCAGIISQESGVALAWSRNEATTKFMQTGVEWFLSVDSDMAFPCNLFELLRHHAQDKTIVAAPYFTFDRHDRSLKPTMFDMNMQPIEDWKLAEVIPARGAGMGAMLINRRVFEVTPYPWFTLAADGSYLEDIGFLMNAERVGVKLLIDTSVQVAHAKGIFITQHDWKIFKENEKTSCAKIESVAKL